MSLFLIKCHVMLTWMFCVAITPIMMVCVTVEFLSFRKGYVLNAWAETLEYVWRD